MCSKKSREKDTVKNDKRTIKWIYEQSKSVMASLFLLTITGILLSFCGVSFALVSKNVIDIAGGNVSGSVIRSSLNLAILIVVQLGLQVLVSNLNMRVNGRLTVSVRRNLFQEVLSKNYADVAKYHSGELINRINSDVNVVTSAVVGIIPNSLAFITRIVLSFWALFMLDRVFAIICLTIGPIVITVAQIYRKKMKEIHKKCQESDGKTRSFMQECLQNLLVIKSFDNENMIVKHSTDLQNENYKYMIKRNHISIIANILFYISITIGYYFALAWGAYKLSKGFITFGTLTAMLQLVGQVQTPFRNLSSVFPQYYSMIASGERIIEILDLPNEQAQNEADLDCKAVYQDMEEIVIENVFFSYNSCNVFKDTELSIKKGEIVAISGKSGIGKSTFLKLLLGIISPTSGDIYIKLTNGDKIALDKKTRGIFAYVPQGNLIISGTIRDNIAFSGKVTNDEYIIKCAETAQIWDYINTLPNKLDTVLGEKGLGLSEGQIQRIAIARAIYSDAPIILLDEATSGLDEKTEIEVLRAMKKLEGKTCIIVSHRRASLKICHKVVSIYKGKFKILI